MISAVVWTCVLLLPGVFCAGSDVTSVSVKEGESVTLYNDTKLNKQDKLIWYFKNTRIAQIDYYYNTTCTDVQCKDGDERFRGRLKMDNHTGNLTIMNTRSTDSGNYTLEIIRTGVHGEKAFSVTVLSVLCAGSDVVSVSVNEGDSVTLHNDIKITKQHRIKWYFKNTQIAEVDLSIGKSCTDVQCDEGDERFRNRLKLDHKTGSLTIINITSTDSGNYTQQIMCTGDNGEKIFNVTVNGPSAVDKHEQDKNSGAKFGIPAAVLLVIGAVVAGVIYYCKCKKERSTGNGVRYTSVQQPDRQEGEQPDRQEGEQPDRQEGEQPDRQEGEQPDRQEGEQPDRQEGEQPDRQEGEQSDRQEDE